MTTIKTFLLVSLEQFRIDIRFKKRYFFSTLITFITNLIVMAGVVLISMPAVAYGEEIESVLQLSNAGKLIGFIYFFLGMVSLGLAQSQVEGWRQVGVIDNIALSPLGVSGVICTRFLPNYLSTLISTFISAGILSVIFKFPIEWHIGILVLNSLIASFGMFGLGLILGGLTIRFKQVGMLSNLLLILLFALGVMPIDYDMTGTFSPLARLFPFTQGLIRTRHALIPGFEDTINVPMFLFLVCSFALFLVGLFVFRAFEKDSIKRGTLGAY